MITHGELFKSIVLFNNYKTVVEVGVAAGATAKSLCEAVKANKGTYFGFDIWDRHGKNLNKNAKLQFQPHGNKEQVSTLLKRIGCQYKLFNINTLDKNVFDSILEDFCPKIDFAFIDADHSYWGVKNDFDVIYPRIKKDGMIAFHDTLRIDGCREFILDLRTKYHDGTYDIVDFPWGGSTGSPDRRVGVSLLVKRSYPVIGLGIDSVCGSISLPDKILEKEENWYESEISKNLDRPNEQEHS